MAKEKLKRDMFDYIGDGKSLYERFTRGEDLSSEQYKIVKEYLMSK